MQKRMLFIKMIAAGSVFLITCSPTESDKPKLRVQPASLTFSKNAVSDTLIPAAGHYRGKLQTNPIGLKYLKWWEPLNPVKIRFRPQQSSASKRAYIPGPLSSHQMGGMKVLPLLWMSAPGWKRKICPRQESGMHRTCWMVKYM